MENREELGTAGAGSEQSQGVGRGRRCVSGPAGEQGPSACFKQENNTVMVTFFFLIALFFIANSEFDHIPSRKFGKHKCIFIHRYTKSL